VSDREVFRYPPMRYGRTGAALSAAEDARATNDERPADARTRAVGPRAVEGRERAPRRTIVGDEMGLRTTRYGVIGEWTQCLLCVINAS